MAAAPENLAKEIRRHNRRQLEAMQTVEQHLIAAVRSWQKTGVWPRRRFRAVTSIGTTYLLSKKKAEHQASRYGGHVEETLPPWNSAKTRAAISPTPEGAEYFAEEAKKRKAKRHKVHEERAAADE